MLKKIKYQQLFLFTSSIVHRFLFRVLSINKCKIFLKYTMYSTNSTKSLYNICINSNAYNTLPSHRSHRCHDLKLTSIFPNSPFLDDKTLFEFVFS